MPQIVEITVTAAIPDDAADLGHEAVFLTRDPVAALVTQLQEIGLRDVKQTRRLVNTKRVERKVPRVVPSAA